VIKLNLSSLLQSSVSHDPSEINSIQVYLYNAFHNTYGFKAALQKSTWKNTFS